MGYDAPAVGRTYFLKPTTTDREDLYTAPNNTTAKVAGITMANDGAADQRMKIEIYDSSATAYHTLFSQTVGTYDSFTFSPDSGEIVLEKGDKVVLDANSGTNTITVSVTVKEIKDPARSGV